MEGIPAGDVLGDQVSVGQLTQQATGLGLGAAGQAGSGGDADVRAGVNAQQPEHPHGLAGELPNRPGEHRPHA